MKEERFQIQVSTWRSYVEGREGVVTKAQINAISTTQ